MLQEDDKQELDLKLDLLYCRGTFSVVEPNGRCEETAWISNPQPLNEVLQRDHYKLPKLEAVLLT